MGFFGAVCFYIHLLQNCLLQPGIWEIKLISMFSHLHHVLSTAVFLVFALCLFKECAAVQTTQSGVKYTIKLYSLYSFYLNYMDTLNFNTFANSPKSLSVYPSKFGSQQPFSPTKSHNPYTNIPELKKQMQEAINSKRVSRNTKKIHSKYPSQISLMKSDVSLLSMPGTQKDLPLSILQLEVGVTEQILAMREDKLTLLEQYNRVIGQKYKIEREIAKLKKAGERQSSDINDLSIFENQNSSSKKKGEGSEVIAKNSALKSEFQSLEKQSNTNSEDFPREYQEQLLLEIQNFQQSSRIIQQKISKIEGNLRPDEEQRFETFFPGKTLSRKQSHPSRQTLLGLREKRAMLYRSLADQCPYSQQQYFHELIQQNEELLQKIERMRSFNRGNGILGLEYLREKVREEEEAKQLFFEDLKKFKEQARRYKAMNEDMRAKLRM